MQDIITVYTKDACIQCRLTIRELDTLGLHYETESAIAHLDELAAQGFAAAPVVFDRLTGESWAGFQPEKLKAAASARSGANS